MTETSSTRVPLARACRSAAASITGALAGCVAFWAVLAAALWTVAT